MAQAKGARAKNRKGPTSGSRLWRSLIRLASVWAIHRSRKAMKIAAFRKVASLVAKLRAMSPAAMYR